MKPGDVVLIHLQEASGGPAKLRPALILTDLPGPYQDLLICGISTQLHRVVADWDEVIARGDGDFIASGLRRDSAARLSYLYSAISPEIAGRIGTVSQERLSRLRARLVKRLT